jgi:hypothetical protein
MDSKTGLSRRYFLYGPLLSAAVPLAGFGSTPSLKALGYKSPNEKLNIACVGSAGRAFEDLAGCSGENIVAIVDVDAKVAAPAFQRYEKAAQHSDFRKMLDQQGKDIDAVIVATPDHMHAMPALWAMERGKHVYVEKPLARTVAEVRMLTETAARYKVATQMGNQGYSNEGARLAAEIVWSGEIGDVTEVHAWTNRPIWPQGLTEIPPAEPVPSTLQWDLWLGVAAARPYVFGGAAYAKMTSRTYGDIPMGFYQPFNWRGFFDFGSGSLGDMACHILGAPHMALRLGAPSSVECIHKEGASPFQFPKKSTIRFEFPSRGSMPPLRLYWYDGMTGPAYRPEGVPATEPLIGGAGSLGARGQMFSGSGPIPGAIPGGRGPSGPGGPVGPGGRGGFPGGGAQNNGAVFVGSKGFLSTDTYGSNVRLLPEARLKDYALPPAYLSRSPGHHRDWIRACKGGEPACSNFSVSGPFAEWIAMGVISLRAEGKLAWDSARMKFTNSAEANRYVRPEVRKGWSLT